MDDRRWRKAREQVLRKYRFSAAYQSGASVPYEYSLGIALVQNAIQNEPDSIVSGQSFSFRVTATKPDGTVKTDYRGRVSFLSPEGQPADSLPEPYTFTEADQGRHSFTATFYTIAGVDPRRRIRVSDSPNRQATLTVVVWFNVLTTWDAGPDPGSCALPSTELRSDPTQVPPRPPASVRIALSTDGNIASSWVGDTGPWYCAGDPNIPLCCRFNESYWTAYTVSVNGTRESYRVRHRGRPLAEDDSAHGYCEVANGSGMDVSTPILRALGYMGDPSQFRRNAYWRFAVPQQ